MSRPALPPLAEAERIVALGGVDARNEVSRCTRPNVLLFVSRLEREGKNRVLVLDRIPGRLRKLGTTETALPTDVDEFIRQLRESGETGCFCAELDPADRPCVNHVPVPDPVRLREPGEDPPLTVTCTRCAKTAAGDEEVGRLFGWRMVPFKAAEGGKKRVHQPQCRACRSLPRPKGR